MFDDVDYFFNILAEARDIFGDLKIGADLWQTEWKVEHLEGKFVVLNSQDVKRGNIDIQSI